MGTIDTVSQFKPSNDSKVTVNLKFNATNATEAFSTLLRSDATSGGSYGKNCIRISFSVDAAMMDITKTVNGTETYLTLHKAAPIAPGKTSELTITDDGNNIQVFIDGSLVVSVTDSTQFDKNYITFADQPNNGWMNNSTQIDYISISTSGSSTPTHTPTPTPPPTPTQYNLTVTKSGNGSGVITTSTGSLTWSGNTGTAGYAPNTSVTLTAKPGMSSTFTGWSGCDTTSASQCTVQMTGNKTVEATFTTGTGLLLTVTKTGNGNGTVTTSTGTLNWSGNTGSALYSPNAQVMLTAEANNGSVFTGWSGCDVPIGNQCSLTMTAAKNVSVGFSGGCKKTRKDFNGDGKSDILWQNGSNGAVYMWFMDGTTVNSGGYADQGVPSDWSIY